MTTFAIDTDNNITAFTAAEQVPEGQDRFATEKEFAKLSADWPITRFPEVWNAFAGVVPFDTLKPVKKFTDRKTAVSPDLEGHPSPDARTRAPGGPRRAKEGQGDQGRHRQGRGAHGARRQQEGHRPGTDASRPDGATLKDIMAATGWQAHSVRGFICGSLGKKMGLTVESFKRPDGERAYRTA